MELITLAIMPIDEAKSLQDQLRKEKIDIRLNHNEQTCTRGCKVTVEVLGKEVDIPQILKIYDENFKRMTEGLDINWKIVDSIFDSRAEVVTCPACSFKFSPTSSECPDCGLAFL